MDIADTYRCNLMNLRSLARYLSVPEERLIGFYEELRADDGLLTEINDRIALVKRDYGFEKAIFRKGSVSSIDWFAFERVLIYVLVRHFQPETCLETGVYYGGNTLFLLAGLKHNGRGRLISIDFPDSQIRKTGAGERHPQVGDSELYEETLRPGFIVPASLRGAWTLHEGDSLAIIPTLDETFNLYVHDSDHAMGFVSREMAAAWPKLAADAMMLVDDIDWSNAFYAFCVEKKLFPLLLTDNGKDDLRIRTGIAWRAHPDNLSPAVTGASPSTTS